EPRVHRFGQQLLRHHHAASRHALSRPAISGGHPTDQPGLRHLGDRVRCERHDNPRGVRNRRCHHRSAEHQGPARGRACPHLTGADQRVAAKERMTAPVTIAAATSRTDAPMPWALLATGALAMFAAASSGTTRAPFLLDMARDLSTSMPLVADLVAATSISWAITGMVAGAGSDRWGRRPFLILGPLTLTFALIGIATAPTFLLVALWSVAAGGCSGMFTRVLFAAASSPVAEGQQGRALGWVMSGQSLTLLVGVPLAAFVGSMIGWRGVNLCVGALAAGSALGLLGTTHGRPPPARAAGTSPPSTRAALSWPVMRVLAMGIAERVCYGLTIVYFATFLQSTYQVSLDAVALPLAIFASGNILGTILGGQLADK